MGIIQKLDEWLMAEVFETIAWRIEYRYDIDNVDLARGCYIGTLMSVPLHGIVCSNFFTVLFSCFMIPFVMHALAPWWKHVKKRSPHTRNRMRDEWHIRFAMTCVILATTITGANVLIIAAVGPIPGIVGVALATTIAAVGFIYFLSCERMPPGYRESAKSLVPSPA